MSAQNLFLPEFPEQQGDAYDVVLVSGDAYVDHPAFGTALIGRYLESLGYRVGIVAQPDWTRVDDFRRFGRPRLFFGVTAGNLDSIVAHYTPARHRRKNDAYTPGGVVGKRPDYASVVYAQRCKEAFPDVPVVLGGVEASLRRLAHYDYVKDKVKASVLADAKADFLIYGMAEACIRALADGLARGTPLGDLQHLPGLAYRTSQPPSGSGVVELPGYEEVAESADRFLDYFRLLDAESQAVEPATLVQAHGTLSVVVNPPAPPLSQRELDRLYELPFTRRVSPFAQEQGGVPALETVRFSVVTHRGCYGGCSFCSITAHQGRGVVSRSTESILAEVHRLTHDPEFRGTLQDVGGPTANMYATGCTRAEPGEVGCNRTSCLVPDVCQHLDTSGAGYLKLLRSIRKVPGVKHAFIASGLRYDLLMLPGQRRLFREVMQHHVGGQMKVAPEHVANRPLRLMNKPGTRKFKEFQSLFHQVQQELEKPFYLIPYLMSGHPGADLRDAVDMALFAKDLGHFAEQVQDFTPTPMTRSTCMYHTGRDPSSGDPVIVPKGKEKAVQRALVQYRDPRNRKMLIEYFQQQGKEGLLKTLYGPNWKQYMERREHRPPRDPARAHPRAQKGGAVPRKPGRATGKK